MSNRRLWNSTRGIPYCHAGINLTHILSNEAFAGERMTMYINKCALLLFARMLCFIWYSHTFNLRLVNLCSLFKIVVHNHRFAVKRVKACVWLDFWTKIGNWEVNSYVKKVGSQARRHYMWCVICSSQFKTIIVILFQFWSEKRI